MRGQDAILEEHDAQDEVIDMAFMAGDEDEPVIFGEVSEMIELFGVDIETIVDDMPQWHKDRGHEFIGDEGEFGGGAVENFSGIVDEFLLRDAGLLCDGGEFSLEIVGLDDFAQELLMGFDFRSIDLRMHGANFFVVGEASLAAWGIFILC